MPSPLMTRFVPTSPTQAACEQIAHPPDLLCFQQSLLLEWLNNAIVDDGRRAFATFSDETAYV